ncbi:MAG: biopolymer transporter ExbD [Fibrobacteria bacterium]|nr:biopolymer transporter ExbD [Fibrobacteria bacterium]
MAKKRVRVEANFDEELNLTPFLDVMIVLIPFLMLTASFFTVVVVDAKLPTPIPPETMPDVKIPPPFDLVVMVPKDSIKIYVNNKDPLGPPQYSVETKDRVDSAGYSEEQIKAYYDILVNIKKQFPTESRLAFDPHPSLQLEKVAQILDQSRNFRGDDPVIKENPAFADTKLFSAIAMKGVYVP